MLRTDSHNHPFIRSLTLALDFDGDDYDFGDFWILAFAKRTVGTWTYSDTHGYHILMMVSLFLIVSFPSYFSSGLVWFDSLAVLVMPFERASAKDDVG